MQNSQSSQSNSYYPSNYYLSSSSQSPIPQNYHYENNMQQFTYSAPVNSILSNISTLNSPQYQENQPQSYNLLSYYQYYNMSHLHSILSPAHAQHIKYMPYIRTARDAISYILSYLQTLRSPYFNSLLAQIAKQLNYAYSIFGQQNQGTDLVSESYYEKQSWMIIIISVYKCMQANYDVVRRKLLRNLCIYLSNTQLKNTINCLRYLQNHRIEVLTLEPFDSFMSRASSVIFDIYQQRANFLQGKELPQLPNFTLINLTKPQLRKERRKIVNIWISGFLSEDMNKKSHWQQLTSLMPDSEIYAVQWTSDCITNLIKFIGKSCIDILNADGIKKQLYNKFSNNPFIPATECAILLGKFLAQMLVRLFPNQFINILGYSLGSDMIVSCLQRIIQLNKQHILNHLYILGGVSDRKKIEQVIRSSKSPLSVSNCYTANDMVLKHVLKLCKPQVQPIGLGKITQIQGHMLQNIQCSHFISGHLSYMGKFSDVGKVLQMTKQS